MFKPILTGIELSTLCLHEFSSKSKNTTDSRKSRI